MAHHGVADKLLKINDHSRGPLSRGFDSAEDHG
jgi:hypothetical protein